MPVVKSGKSPRRPRPSRPNGDDWMEDSRRKTRKSADEVKDGGLTHKNYFMLSSIERDFGSPKRDRRAIRQTLESIQSDYGPEITVLLAASLGYTGLKEITRSRRAGLARFIKEHKATLMSDRLKKITHEQNLPWDGHSHSLVPNVQEASSTQYEQDQGQRSDTPKADPNQNGLAQEAVSAQDRLAQSKDAPDPDQSSTQKP
ncbi:hypothetical protein H2203_005277, partial [Taxawa tesnikishii (nom. ined.)]